MELNPIDKVHDLIERFKEYHLSIRRKWDNGYEWLEEENDICVVITNPSSENSIEIECQDDGEFTVYFAANHSHYVGDDAGYEYLCGLIMDILDNKKCSAALFYGKESKWIGSSMIDSEELKRSVWDVFDYVLKYEEFAACLKGHGGSAQYVFWNSDLNQTIEIGRETEDV